MKYKVIDKTFNSYEEALAYTRTIQGGSGASMIETINDDAQPSNPSSNEGIGSFLDTLFGQAQNGSEKDRAAGRAFSENEVQEARMNWMMQQNQRDYEQELYDQRYSFQGQINQMQQSGLNPALMYGGVGTTASQGGAVGQTAEGPSHDTTASPTDRLNSFISLFSSLFGIGTDIAEKINTIKSGRSQRALNEKEGALTDARTDTERANKLNVEADTANKEANTDYTRNKQELETSMAFLDRAYRRGQIDKQEWEIRQDSLDYLFDSLTFGDRWEAIKLQNDNLRETKKFIISETAEKWSQVSLNDATEELTRLNKDIQEYAKTNAALDTSLREYAQLYNLPPDQPAVIMMHQNLNDALARAQVEAASSPDPEVRKQAQKDVKDLSEAMVKIRKACMQVSQGKMTSKEQTELWVGVIKDVGKAAAAATIARSAGKAAGKEVGTTITYGSGVRPGQLGTLHSFGQPPE